MIETFCFFDKKTKVPKISNIAPQRHLFHFTMLFEEPELKKISPLKSFSNDLLGNCNNWYTYFSMITLRSQVCSKGNKKWNFPRGNC